MATESEPECTKEDFGELVGELEKEANKVIQRATAANTEEEQPYEKLRHIPSRLLERIKPVPKNELLSTRKENGIPDEQLILVLYAGKDDSTSLESAIQNTAPWLSPHVLAIDKIRDANHDMLSLGMYSHLYWKALEGDILAVIGGPPRETWQHTVANATRGNEYGHVWGTSGLTEEQWIQQDAESTLVLRQLSLYEAASQGNPDCKFLLEHPADPARTGGDSRLPSIWNTKTIKSFQTRHNMIMTTFSMCNLGTDCNQPTTILTKNMPGMRKLNNWMCRHKRHDGNYLEVPERWPWGLNSRISISLKDSMLWLKEYIKRNGLPDSNRDNVRH